jgi:hypothetical protein
MKKRKIYQIQVTKDELRELRRCVRYFHNIIWSSKTTSSLLDKIHSAQPIFKSK